MWMLESRRSMQGEEESPQNWHLKTGEAVKDRRWKRRSNIEALDEPVERKLASCLKVWYVKGKKKKEGTKDLYQFCLQMKCVEVFVTW